MPIYEYECADCRRLTEALLKIGEKEPRKCPHCGGKLSRLISRTSFQLKGGGWYKDLYASSKPESKPSEGGETAAASESKAEAKPETKGGAEAAPAAPSSKPAKAEPAAKSAGKSSAPAKSKKTG
jgi:putative FmdB family regulatory protein